MIEEIKQEWHVPKYKLSITSEKKVLTEDLKMCNEEVYQGRLVFRIPKTSTRVSRKYIQKNAIKEIKVIQQFIPF